MASGGTDFLRKNQQHIQQLMVQRQHDISVAQAAVIAEERQRQKLRQKVLSMRENRPAQSDAPEQATQESLSRTFDHSETMPSRLQSDQRAVSPLRRCSSASNAAKQSVSNAAQQVRRAMKLIHLLHPFCNIVSVLLLEGHHQRYSYATGRQQGYRKVHKQPLCSTACQAPECFASERPARAFAGCSPSPPSERLINLKDMSVIALQAVATVICEAAFLYCHP